MQTIFFDVLIVYSESAASSATTASAEFPFNPDAKNAGYNEVYGYFLQTCLRKKLKAAFASSADIIAPGVCKAYWLFERGKWKKVLRHGFSPLIFDKLTPTSDRLAGQRSLLFSHKQILPFNDPTVYALFFDKQKTYKKLKAFAIPTVLVPAHTIAGITSAVTALSEIMQLFPSSQDFSTDIILKDRFGAGGTEVYKFKSHQIAEMHEVLKEKMSTSFILQPFTKFDSGFLYEGERVSADIRLIYLGGKIVQSYVRIAQKNSFLCNEHQGGRLRYISLSEIPKSVREQADKIAFALDKNTSLFALDFVVSNSGNSYFLEGNTGPGLDWNPLLQKNTEKGHEFIQLIVQNLASRAVSAQHTKTRTQFLLQSDTRKNRSNLFLPALQSADLLASRL